ncbi:hypothetical protein O1157_26450 [Streptomyces albogriseolus]
MNAATGSEAPLPDERAPAAVADAGDGDDVPRPALVRYALGSAGMGVYVTVPGLLLLYFLTDTLGVAPGWPVWRCWCPRPWTSSCTRTSARCPTGSAPAGGPGCGC